MPDEQTQAEPRIKRAWTVSAAWIAGITTVIGFIGTLTGTFSSITEHFHQHKAADAQVSVAQTQFNEGEYAQAEATYAAALKDDSGYKPAIDGQLLTAEKWVENFSVTSTVAPDVVSAGKAQLEQLASIFETALGRAKGGQKADIQAHLGWTHWLQFHLFSLDTETQAEQDLRAALETDKNNVYANAMLGNVILQNHGSLGEASQLFDTAVATGKERAFVRRLQIGGFTRDEIPGARAALFRALDSMRKNNEPLDEGRKMNARGFCCYPGGTSHDELFESLSVVPRDDAWKTYQWLNDANQEDPVAIQQKGLFIQAMLAEIAGDREGAVRQFRALNKQAANAGTMLDEVIPDEIKRLTSASR